jgi:hypothetical protein
MTQYIGRVTVRLNGETWESKPGAQIDLGGIERQSQVTDQDMGFTETPKPSRIEAEFAVKRGLTLDPLQSLTDATAVFEADTGQRWIIKDAYRSDTLVVTGNGGAKVVIMGKPAQEVVS